MARRSAELLRQRPANRETLTGEVFAHFRIGELTGNTVNLEPTDDAVDWMEKVTDEEYAKVK